MGVGGVVRMVVREFPGTPVVYLTAAPLLLRPLVRRVLRVDGYPAGTLLAPSRPAATWRDGGARHKRDALRQVLAGSDRSWILLGDDGGPAPALYAHAAARHGLGTGRAAGRGGAR